jgi:regulation of enolase protein 1 (concanavalin A-like superfamily)
MSQWNFWNYEGEMIKDPSAPFTLECSPGTDLWEKPPSVHSANAPCLLHPATKGSFISAKVTASAEWARQYDQGGLVMIIHDSSGDQRWIKTGIEFFNGQPLIGTVATYRWSDWSLTPVISFHSASVTVEIESNEDGSLWVYLFDDSGNKSPIREVTWWGEIDEQVKVSVGVYLARVDKEPTNLVVSFKGLEIKTREV